MSIPDALRDLPALAPGLKRAQRNTQQFGHLLFRHLVHFLGNGLFLPGIFVARLFPF
ncbi:MULTISPECIES: hypothetical protein [unclassified Pseudomonas]|uniref:hypothetical protein n=1 Tax=unclassified Pseudomonas TaxID=196821 RepID=UPI0013048D28|nr:MULTISPECIES: hypothetical protein [unclassified Pseudomonas]